MGFTDEPLDMRRVIVTPPEIWRSHRTLGEPYRRWIEGRNFLLWSTFPVVLRAGGRYIGAAGGSFPPFYRFRFSDTSPAGHWIEFLFPAGFGGDVTDPAGNTLIPAELGPHGICILDSSWADEGEPQIINPDLLPTDVWTHTQATALNTAPGIWGIQSIGAATAFRVPAAGSMGQVPAVLWVKSVNLYTETLFFPYGEDNQPAEFLLFKGSAGGPPVTPNDQANIVSVCLPFGSPKMVTFPNYMIPWRSLISPWAAEVPTINGLLEGPKVPAAEFATAASFDVQVRFCFSYLVG